MYEITEPLLQTSQRAAKFAQIQAFSCFALLFFIFLIFKHSNFWESIETPISADLPGCKIIAGHYQLDFVSGSHTHSQNFYLAQYGCRGRDVDDGTKFSVFGSRVTIPQDDQKTLRGSIQSNGDILWDDGKRWVLKSAEHDGGTVAVMPQTTERVSTRNDSKCLHIGGTYEEVNEEDQALSGDRITYEQNGCTGADMTHGYPFTVTGNHIQMLFTGTDVSGEVAKDGKIHWSNGFIHKPLFRSALAADVAGNLIKDKSLNDKVQKIFERS